MHVAGDIHQPLHSVSLFNETYPEGDRGGNRIKISLENNETVNLHQFWDSGGFRISKEEWSLERPLNTQNITLLKNKALSLIK